MILTPFQDLFHNSFFNVEVRGKVEVDSLIYDFETDIFDHLHGNDININSISRNNSIFVLLENFDETKHDVSFELTLNIDNNIYNTTHNDEYFSISTQQESLFFFFDLNNSYFTYNQNEIVITQYVQSIEPHNTSEVEFLKFFTFLIKIKKEKE